MTKQATYDLEKKATEWERRAPTYTREALAAEDTERPGAGYARNNPEAL